MSKTTFDRVATADVLARFSFLEPSLVQKFLIRPSDSALGPLLFIDPITIITVVAEVGSYLNEQYKSYNEQKWKNDVTSRLIRIEQQLNALTDTVNELFGFTQAVVQLQSIYEQNAYLARQRSLLETVMSQAQKHDAYGWPKAIGAQVDIVETAREVASNAAGLFTRTELYGYAPFISVYSAAMVEATAMLVVPENDRKVVAKGLDFYIEYFKSALSDVANSLPKISVGLGAIETQSASEMDNYPKFGSIGVSKPGVMDPDYDPDAFPPTVPRTSWSLFQIAGNKDEGFSAGPVTHTFEWQTPDKILPQPPGITFGRETWDVERVSMILRYLNDRRPAYLKAKAQFDGSQLQIALASTMLDQLLVFQRTLGT